MRSIVRNRIATRPASPNLANALPYLVGEIQDRRHLDIEYARHRSGHRSGSTRHGENPRSKPIELSGNKEPEILLAEARGARRYLREISSQLALSSPPTVNVANRTG